MFNSKADVGEDSLVGRFKSYSTVDILHFTREQAHCFRCHEFSQQNSLAIIFPLIVQEIWFHSREITFRGRCCGNEIGMGEDIRKVFPILKMKMCERVND
jgi:hypothetical protein